MTAQAINVVAEEREAAVRGGPLTPAPFPREGRGCQQRVLMVQHCAEYSGSTISGQLTAEGFLKAGWGIDVAFGFEGPAIANYEELGCRTHVVPHKNWLRGGNVLQSGKRMWQEWRNARVFQRLIRDVRPDVVHVNSLVSLAAAVAARRERLPCVWHVRELFDDVGGEMRVPAVGGKRLVRWALNRLAAQRVVLSRAVLENVLGGESTGVEVVPNAVGEEFFDVAEDQRECRALLGLPADTAIVGVPATLRPVKGLPFFFDAAVRIAEVKSGCVFAVTGDGEAGYAAELKRQVAALGLEEQVRFLGTVRDMPRFYRACDVVCVPSQSESFGRTVIESFAVGTPVVATAVGGMRETIEEGRTGLLVDYGDVAGLSKSVVRLLGDAALHERLAVDARREAEGMYKAEAYQAALCGIVEQVVRSGVRG